MIARDAGWTPEPGLEVYDKDGQKVGCVDQASDAQGWMQAEALGLGLQRLGIPYRLIKSVVGGAVMVTLTKDELHAGCTNPPARNTEVVRRDGKAIAVTCEAGGRDEEWVVAGEATSTSTAACLRSSIRCGPQMVRRSALRVHRGPAVITAHDAVDV